MSGPWGPESGRDDQGWLKRLRELVDDHPKRAVEQFSMNGIATEAKCTQVKINDDDQLVVTSNGFTVPIVYDPDEVSAGNVYVDCNTGWLLFGTAPPVGQANVIVYKRQVRWRDSNMLQALYGGLLFLYPYRFREAQDTSIMLQTMQWDYTLPSDFNIPDIYIRSIMVREVPSSTNRFRPLTGWTRERTTLTIARSQMFTPGSTVEVNYTAPYRSLSDVDDVAADVVLWYAAAQLQGFGETPRTRMASQTVQADQNAQPPGFAQQTAAWYMSRATQIRNDLQRAIPWSRPKSTLDV